MPLDYSKWEALAVSESDKDEQETTSTDEDRCVGESRQLATKRAAKAKRPASAPAVEAHGEKKNASPDSAEALELVVTSFDNEKVERGWLATVLNSAGCSGRGLLLCQVYAREGQSSAKLIKPVATQQNVLPLCKKARQSQWSQACDRALHEAFPGHTALAFQFISSDLWKTVAEPKLEFKVNRHNLNAKNIAVVVAILMLPSKDRAKEVFAITEVDIYQQGALLPKEVSACLTSSQKESIGKAFRKLPASTSFEQNILRLCGLDHSLLKEDPVYQQLLEGLRACSLANMKSRDLSFWVNSDGQTGSLDHRAELCEATLRFLDENRVLLDALCFKLGAKCRDQTRARLLEERDQHSKRRTRYSANFEGHLTPPCPVCSKPLPNSPYPCSCQRPSLEPPFWPGHHNNSPSSPDVSTVPSPVGRRRGKNVQTSWSAAGMSSR